MVFKFWFGVKVKRNKEMNRRSFHYHGASVAELLERAVILSHLCDVENRPEVEFQVSEFM